LKESVINIEGMACEHCVKAVNSAVSALNGVTDVSVDLQSGTATVKYNEDAVTLKAIMNEIEEQGYDVIR
jgi:copper chaperone